VTQKDFDSEAKAQAEAARLVIEKTKKGYAEKV
jgi:predicted DNA-binding WGR domain protein